MSSRIRGEPDSTPNWKKTAPAATSSGMLSRLHLDLPLLLALIELVIRQQMRGGYVVDVSHPCNSGLPR